MELFSIYCSGCSKIIGEAYAKENSGVAHGHINDEYFCADCATRERQGSTAFDVIADDVLVPIRWKRSDDGLTVSHCGEWWIEANYNHSTSPQGYTIHYRGRSHLLFPAFTVREAKRKVERIRRDKLKGG